MDKYNFTSGGFPLTIEHLQNIENQVQTLSALAKIAGVADVPMRLKGCTLSGDQSTGFAISEGVVLLNGELINVDRQSFELRPDFYSISEETSNKTYLDGVVNNYLTKKRLVFSTSASDTALPISYWSGAYFNWENRISNIESVNAAQQGLITSIGTGLTALTGRVSSAESVNVTQNTRLSSLESLPSIIYQTNRVYVGPKSKTLGLSAKECGTYLLFSTVQSETSISGYTLNNSLYVYDYIGSLLKDCTTRSQMSLGGGSLSVVATSLTENDTIKVYVYHDSNTPVYMNITLILIKLR